MVLTGSVWPKFRYIYEPSCSELYTLCTPTPAPHTLLKKQNFLTLLHWTNLYMQDERFKFYSIIMQCTLYLISSAMSANNTWISNTGFLKRYQIETRLISLIMKAFYVNFPSNQDSGKKSLKFHLS